MKILVTGGAGFIGSYLVKLWLREDKEVSLVNLDKLTYCGDLSRLSELEGNPRYTFFNGDVCNPSDLARALEDCEGVVHLAAETHVDRSLLDGKVFFETNTYGTYALLEEARKKGVKKFLYVSTDEVYGSREKGFFVEKDALNPSSPYSVSKVAADLLVSSYAHTHGMHTLVTRGSNTFGPYQYPEKVIPLFVSNALSNQKLPLYGDGLQIRNWIYVEDHCRGILAAFMKGEKGEIYNISSENYLTNIELTRRLLKVLGKPESLIQSVKDRLGHDRRYAIDSSKMKKELGWRPLTSFEAGIKNTIQWYVKNYRWLKRVKAREKRFKIS